MRELRMQLFKAGLNIAFGECKRKGWRVGQVQVFGATQVHSFSEGVIVQVSVDAPKQNI